MWCLRIGCGSSKMSIGKWLKRLLRFLIRVVCGLCCWKGRVGRFMCG